MCKHATTTQQIIDRLNVELYPRLLHEFNVALETLPTAGSAHELAITEAFSELRQAFMSLVAYEQRLVFPSVITVFSHKKNAGGAIPNSAELQTLTKIKAQKLQLQALHLQRFVDASVETTSTKALQLLCHSLLNDFMQFRQDWNHMIDERMRNCACFLQLQNVNPQKPIDHANV
jgi:hypothetical protein